MNWQVFLLSTLLLGSPAMAHNSGSNEGSSCEGFQRDSSDYRDRGKGYNRHSGRGNCRGGGYRGSNRGGRYYGRHGQWDIPLKEARKLNPIEVSAQSLKLGETLYRDKCTRCHGMNGSGDGPQARDLSVPPAMLRHATRHYSDGELFYIISKGREPMPAWEETLSENERWHLINYLRFEIGAHRGGPRFNDCDNRYQSEYEETDSLQEHPDSMQDEQNNQESMEHEEPQEEEQQSTHASHQTE